MAGRSRRTVAVLLVVVLGAALAGSGCSGDDDAGARAERATTTAEVAVRATVEVPEYPFWPNDVYVEDQALLDDLATEYAVEADDPGDTERFLYGWAPIAAFDRIFAEDLSPDEVRALLGLFHLSGYFGGVWLRGAIDRAQPGTSAIANLRTAPTEDGFRSSVADAQAALDAAEAGGDALIAYNEQSLFPQGEGGFTGDGLAQGFGYNQGYMLQILEAPPSGLTTPDRYGVTCTGVFACEYVTPRLDALASLADVQAALAEGAPSYDALAPRLAAEQDAFVPQGRAVWSSGLSVEGFTQRDYETLLDVSSSFLETLQATALAATKAAAERDEQTGRRAAIANAAMAAWLSAYSTGLTEGRDPTDVPKIVASG